MSGSGRFFPHNIKKILWDISGAFGDIGVLFPIAIALIMQNGFNPTALFLAAGLFYILAAYYFKITMPVQPLKAMSAIAIATGLSFHVINAAGIIMGFILIILAVTRFSVKLGSIFPVSVVRGIQLGLGFMLIKTSFGMMNMDISVVFVAGFILLASIVVFKKIPPLIPILLLAIALSAKRIELTAVGPVALSPGLPALDTLWIGFTLLVIPQIALTFGNAIVATEATGHILYGEKAKKLNLVNIPASMGIANIVSGIMGGAPMCHGSGGLTAHCKFGATSPRSGYIIGFSLIVLAVLFGSSAMAIISVFPKGILGVLLCYVGLQHSLFVRDILQDRAALSVALTTAIAGFVTGNLTIGFLAGFGMHYALMGFHKTMKFLEEH
ncbi:MAG: putative sulfate/molybdate transporter [Nitrospiraceae bacterium]|nr:MAG: putative sulfate/molybdate transporter [Nitrospiraceae bacterium]